MRKLAQNRILRLCLGVHDHVFFLELGQAVGYFRGEFRLGFCSPIWSNRRLSATFQHLRVLRRPTGLLPRDAFVHVREADISNEAPPVRTCRSGQ